MNIYQGGDRGQFSVLACGRDWLGSGVMGGGKGVLQSPRNVVGGVKGESKDVPPEKGEGVKNKQAVQ